MNDLSNSSDPQKIQSVPLPVSQAVPVAPSGAKEVEPGKPSQEGLRDATGQEVSIPKEVISAGVRIHPTTIPIPPRVSQLGVKPAGANVPIQTTTTVILPLTDEQIAIGLHQSIANSVRWLSEWCVRRFKQLHIVVKTVHGRLIREKV